jgi:osmotically-inducible protein OsmY
MAPTRSLACIDADTKQHRRRHPLKREHTMKSLKHVYTLLATLAIATTLGCAGTAQKESTGEYFDDVAITAKVKSDILGEPTLKSAEINVETFKGVVQLSGFVSSQANVNTAIVVAKNVKGVSSVTNKMTVK